MADAYFELAKAGVGPLVREVVKSVAGKRHLSSPDARRRYTNSVNQMVATVDDGAFEAHLRDAAGWAEITHVHGMSKALMTEQTSISLDFDPVLREFRVGPRSDAVFTEDAFLSSPDSFMILGDPGSGKTTTMKRLVLRSLEIIGADVKSPAMFPLVIVCREVLWSSTGVCEEILSRVGVNVAEFKKVVGDQESVLVALAASVLDKLSILVFVDGLDEISDSTSKRRAIQTISRINRSLEEARFICTCRIGDAAHLEGLAVAELLPLTHDQVADLVDLRGDSSTGFLEAVRASGHAEILDRPLLLNQILTVYEVTGSLPERPVDLNRALLRLLLHEWDEQRSITRPSRYSGFDAATKQEFLAHIAFALTIRGRSVFRHEDLEEIYRNIADRYGLPNNDARTVLREIESHVGIIAVVHGGYQFSHFTLQEHLCGEHIVRRFMNDETAEYLRWYPAIVAVAVALSSSPTEWMVECVRRAKRFETFAEVDTFAARLGLERPRFTASAELGVSVLHLMAQAARRNDYSAWTRIAELPAVRTSVELAEVTHEIKRTNTDVSFSRRASKEINRTSVRRVPDGVIPRRLYDMFQV